MGVLAPLATFPLRVAVVSATEDAAVVVASLMLIGFTDEAAAPVSAEVLTFIMVLVFALYVAANAGFTTPLTVKVTVVEPLSEQLEGRVMTTTPAVAVLIPVVIGMPEGQPVEVLKVLVGVHPVTEATGTVGAAVLKVTVIVPPASAAGEVLKPTVQFEDAETKLLPGAMVTAETEEAPALTTSSPRLIVTSAKKANAN